MITSIHSSKQDAQSGEPEIEARPVSPATESVEEQQLEQSLRPQDLNEIIGMAREKANLRVMIDASRKRTAALDHVLLHGPPGLGKTSLALAVSTEMGVPVHITTGPAISRAGDLAAMLTALEPRSILFIDEIHRLRHAVEEILYPAMEDRVIDILIGKGPSAKTVRLELPPFTIIAATTKLSMLSAPLRNRFGVDLRVDFYSVEDLEAIVRQKATKLGMQVEAEAATLIAERARMTARIAVRILKRARDFAVVQNHAGITLADVESVLKLLEIDAVGLDLLDRRILHALHVKFSGRPVGLTTLAASLAEEPNTVEEVYEPFLLQRGLIERTPRGRSVTIAGVEYILANPHLFSRLS